MKKNISSFLIGILFSIGLMLSGMTDPKKVQGFLDIFGNWDPSLLFVMVGAIGIHFFAYRLILKRNHPILSDRWMVPTRRDITPALAIGAVIFGIGWGLGGYCPGPAITSLSTLKEPPLVFVVGMILGMILFNSLEKFLPFKR